MNSLTNSSSSNRSFCTYTVCTACLNSVLQPSQHTAVPKQFFEGTVTAVITLHNKSPFLSPAHTHMQLNTVCTEGGNRKISWFVNTSKLVKAIKNKTTPQSPYVTVEYQ